MKSSSYRNIERPKRMSHWRSIALNTRSLLQKLSRRTGIGRMCWNVFCCYLIATSSVVAMIILAGFRLSEKFLSMIFSRRYTKIEFNIKNGPCSEYSVMVSLYQSSLLAEELQRRIESTLERSGRFLCCTENKLGGWVQLWTAAREVNLNNHLIELSPTWKHQLVNEENLDEVVSHVAGLPFDQTIPPWQVFVLPLLKDREVTSTCVILRGHRTLLPELLKCLSPENVKDTTSSHASRNKFHKRVETFTLDMIIGMGHLLSPGLSSSVLRGFCYTWAILKKLSELLTNSKKKFVQSAATYFNLPRMLIENVFLSSIREPAFKLRNCSSVNVTWSDNIPLDFFDTICQETDTSREELILVAVTEALEQHYKRTLGNAPDEVALQLLPPVDLGLNFSDVNMEGQFNILLPCSTASSQRVFSSVRNQLSRLRQYETQSCGILLHPFVLYASWPLRTLARCIMNTKHGFVAMETTSSPGITSSSLIPKFVFSWGSAGGIWPLHLCLSIQNGAIHFGAVSTSLNKSELKLIVHSFERHVYQIAADNGVQLRRLSPYSSPSTSPSSTPVQTSPTALFKQTPFPFSYA